MRCDDVMVRWVGLWFVCSCNWAFGLETTRPLDAAFFDAAPDSAWACPPMGTLPQFAPTLHQLDVGLYCTDYTLSPMRGLAMAACRGSTMQVAQGPIEGLLVAAAGISPTQSMRVVDQPRLTYEGDEVWVRQVSTQGTTVGSLFSVFHAVGDAWQWSADLAVPTSADRGDEISAPTRRDAGPRRFIFNMPSEDRIAEMMEGNPPTIVHTYRNVDLGMAYIIGPMLSPDGLRLVFGGQRMTDLLVTTMYVDRPNLGAMFGIARPLHDAPAATDPFLTDDCGKLYASGLGRIFYGQQE
jgi:hypothetical protein